MAPEALEQQPGKFIPDGRRPGTARYLITIISTAECDLLCASHYARPRRLHPSRRGEGTQCKSHRYFFGSSMCFVSIDLTRKMPKKSSYQQYKAKLRKEFRGMVQQPEQGQGTDKTAHACEEHKRLASNPVA